MISFTNWLAQAFEVISAVDPFYSERLVAFKKLNDAVFIGSQKENYKYITLQERLNQLISSGYQAKVPTKDCPQQAVKIGAVDYGHEVKTDRLVFVNGVWSKAASSFDSTCNEVQLRRVADLPLQEQKAIVSRYMPDLESCDDIFATLNILLSQETYLLDIGVHTQVEKIITIQHIITESITHVVPQLILTVGQSSQVTIVENWYATGNKVQNFINNLIYVVLAEDAKLTYYTLHTESLSGYQVSTLYCNQKDRSVFTHYSFSFGSVMLRMNLSVQINGSYVTTMLYGLYILSINEQTDYHVQVRHNCPHSLSKQHYKCVLGGEATGVFNGKIYLTPEAQKTNGYQVNNAIVLSDKAHHYVRPQLEIYADDVKCSHGATAGQLDQEQLFYLQTRGIELVLAKRLLLEAFGKEIISQVSIKALQDYLWDKVLEKLKVIVS